MKRSIVVRMVHNVFVHADEFRSNKMKAEFWQSSMILFLYTGRS